MAGKLLIIPAQPASLASFMLRVKLSQISDNYCLLDLVI